MKLTSRERFLMVVLGFVVLIVGVFQFVFKPMVEKMVSYQSELVELQAKEQEIQITIRTLSDIDLKLNQEKQKMEQEDYFYKNLDYEEMDILVQDMADDRSLHMAKSEFLDPIETEVPPFSRARFVLNYPIKSQKLLGDQKAKEEYEKAVAEYEEAQLKKEAASNTNEEEEESTDHYPIVPMYRDILTVNGSLDNIMLMIDTVNNLGKSVTIAAFNTSERPDIPGSVEATLQIDYYFLD